jgi:deazaflavin-dependent oxidoreductase (nitroreductase family)
MILMTLENKPQTKPLPDVKSRKNRYTVYQMISYISLTRHIGSVSLRLQITRKENNMWYNPIMHWLLRSPLHFFVRKNMMLLTFTGRKSGNSYTTPVSYLSIDNELYTISSRDRVWWCNLRGGVQVTLRLRGEDVIAFAETFEDREQVIAHFQRYFQVSPQMIRYMKVKTDRLGIIKPDQIERLAREKVVVCTKLK